MRPALVIVLGYIGTLVARLGTPSLFAFAGDYFALVAFAGFAILGYILPDIIEVTGRAGIMVLARQIANYVQVPVANRRLPRINFPKRKKTRYENPMVVDTSALIDGRLVDVVKTGFLFGTFLVLPSVVRELHALSDSADDLKRSKGRRGLDNLKAIQSSKKVKVEMLNSEPKDQEVDHKLITIAKNMKGKMVTVDFNLNKVAGVRGVQILNVNELANSVKTVVLPQDKLSIEIVAKGKEKDQGVGYLDDGTMVVVESGVDYVGKRVSVVALRVLQTVAGKMIFAKADKK